MRKFTSLLFLTIVSMPPASLLAQNPSIDVTHYRFGIAVNDSTDIIYGQAAINFTLMQRSNSSYFDLVGINDSTGKGMKVARVFDGRKDLKFEQDENRLNIFFGVNEAANSQKEVQVFYKGVPADGLIIDTNKYGNRTFFADNWPNRAHNWIPCNDHPADKASVEFVVTAPDNYQVVANGILVEESNIQQHRKLTHWKEDQVLPTKVMVIGVADFAVQLVDQIDCIPITSWVFPENRDSGFAQYAVAKNILPFYIHYLGPYPYKKLANVQSKTLFGGMENASNIFYYENSVLTKNMKPDKNRKSTESLFAHEIAHQWFGDETSESDWPHIWLSEGFATYMAHLFIGYRYGTDSLQKEMEHDRDLIVDFYKKHKRPVVDTFEKNNLMQLLNVNSYEKGSWVLHMLRHKLGDEIFKKGIGLYYKTYKGKNASTEDFLHIMERVSGQNLRQFFKQWLYAAGHPVLNGKWQYDTDKKLIDITIIQDQRGLFEFPLQLRISNGKETVSRTIEVSQRNTTQKIPVEFKPTSVLPDPDVNLLFEGQIEAAK